MVAPSLVMKLFITENIRIFISEGREGFQKTDLHYGNIGWSSVNKYQLHGMEMTEINSSSGWNILPAWVGATWFDISWKYFSALFSVSAWQVGSVSVCHSLLAVSGQLHPLKSGLPVTTEYSGGLPWLYHYSYFTSPPGSLVSSYNSLDGWRPYLEIEQINKFGIKKNLRVSWSYGPKRRVICLYSIEKCWIIHPCLFPTWKSFIVVQWFSKKSKGRKNMNLWEYKSSIN